MPSPSSIGRLNLILGLSVLSAVVCAQDQPSLSGVIETYGVANSNIRGGSQQMSWAEFRARVSHNWSVTWSGYDAGSYSGYDESYARYELDNWSIRAGRLRTSFGFSDWSELFYNGFNHKPLIREMNIVGKTWLDRDDAGAEFTVNSGALQLQASAVQTQLTRAQVGASGIDHGTLTAQYGVGPFILGAEALWATDWTQKVYGANIRYTIPHWIFKGEYFEGVGPTGASGSYIDATYRLPSHLRTEIVARTERVRSPRWDSDIQLETIGIRHIFNRFLSANVNYGWGKDLGYSFYATSANVSGWTGQLLFQVQF